MSDNKNAIEEAFKEHHSHAMESKQSEVVKLGPDVMREGMNRAFNTLDVDMQTTVKPSFASRILEGRMHNNSRGRGGI